MDNNGRTHIKDILASLNAETLSEVNRSRANTQRLTQLYEDERKYEQASITSILKRVKAHE